MRISDWSSDVCSSDLARARRRRDTGGELEARPFSITQLNLPINPNPWKAIALDGFIDRALPLWPASLKTSKCRYFRTACWPTRRKPHPIGPAARAHCRLSRDRKSAVSGQSASVRVYLGGGRSVKKN